MGAHTTLNAIDSQIHQNGQSLAAVAALWAEDCRQGTVTIGHERTTEGEIHCPLFSLWISCGIEKFPSHDGSLPPTEFTIGCTAKGQSDIYLKVGSG